MAFKKNIHIMLGYIRSLTFQEKAIIITCLLIGIGSILYFSVVEPMILARQIAPEDWASYNQ
jgi:hypothetical protein